MRSGVVLVFILILTASSLTMVKPAGSSAPNVSVPEFTVKFVGQPYDAPITYSLDPYTGANVTNPGYHVTNGTIVVTIKNQPFDSSKTYSLCYNVQVKGHFGGNWKQLYDYSLSYPYYSSGVSGLRQSDSEYTVVSCSADYPPNSQIDIQVQALVYNKTDILVANHALAPQLGSHYEQQLTLVETSGWSSTQTVTIPGASPLPSAAASPTLTPTITLAPTPTSTQEQTVSPTPNPTQQPTGFLETAIPMGYVLVMIAAIVIALIAGIIIGFRIKSRKNSKKTVLL